MPREEYPPPDSLKDMILALTNREATMKTLLALFCCACVVLVASAQEKPSEMKVASAGSSTEKLLETKIRKIWEDYKIRNKTGLGSVLASDFREVTDDADGIFGKETEFSEMEKFTLSHYELSTFQMKSIGKMPC